MTGKNELETRLLIIAVPLLCGTLATTQSGQEDSSIHWMTTLERSLPSNRAFHQSMLGPQLELVFQISLANFEGGPVYGIDRIPNNIRATVRLEGEAIATTEQLAFSKPAPASLEPGDGLEITVTIRPLNESAFTLGGYVITLDLSSALRDLRHQDGSAWRGRAKKEEIRYLEIKPISSVADRAAFLEVEGNFWLGKHDAARALTYLEELVQLRPEDWRANAALGAACLRVRRYKDAVTFLERALPAWLRFTERSGGVVANELGSAYLALGRESEAVRVLRASGLSGAQVSQRLSALRATVRQR
jgi:hypothetical protein